VFQHPNAESASIEIEFGDKVERVLVIRTKLSLWPVSAEYNDSAVNDLEVEARAFIARNGIDRIRMISTRES
jgi:hypothetical protein